jgi:hypothetical protein
MGQYGNSVGRVFVKFVGEQATLSNQGFANYPPNGWFNGMLLGKADEYVWPIAADSSNPSVASFTFDHGASDLVFGDVLSSSRQSYRPEFEEVIYTRTSSGDMGMAMGMGMGMGMTPSFQSPQAALDSQLREEAKESLLKLGTWHSDGYFPNPERPAAQFQYTPKLKLSVHSAQRRWRGLTLWISTTCFRRSPQFQMRSVRLQW